MIYAVCEIKDLKEQLEIERTTYVSLEDVEPVQEVEKVEPVVEEVNDINVADLKSDTFKLTAYCACGKCCGKWADGYTASGTKATQGRTIAVDTKVIPLGTKVNIAGLGTYIAEDTGSAIKGNRIDVYFESHQEALKFGVKNLNVEWEVI